MGYWNCYWRTSSIFYCKSRLYLYICNKNKNNHILARLSGKSTSKLEELKEMDQKTESNSKIEKVIGKIKHFMFKLLGRLGFFGILVFASVKKKKLIILVYMII